MSTKLIASTMLAFMLLTQVIFAADPAPVVNGQQSTAISVSEAQPVFIIKLISNPTTGYVWSLRHYDKTLLTAVKHEYHAPKTDLIGAPGYELWTFRAKPAAFAVPARTKLSFVYARPWESDQAGSAAEFVVTFQA